MSNHLDNDKDLQELFPCINCGINADPADGFGNCTCGNEKLREEIDQYTQSKLKAFAGEFEKAVEGLKVDREATEKHIRSIEGMVEEEAESRVLDMQISADDTDDMLNDVLEALKAIKEKAGIE